MKKYFRAVLAILILTVLSGGIVGCDFETQYSKNLKRIFETEYFRCINYEGEDTVTILELTELGKQQEVLVIPETIRGYKVVELAGSIKGWTYGPVQRESYIIHLDNLKKLYLSAKIMTVSSKHSFSYSRNLIIVSQDEQEVLLKRGVFPDCVMVSLNDNGFTEYRKANVEYFLNIAGEKKPYWIDYIDKDRNEFLLPDIPKRDGYRFVCWCTDKDGKKERDGI